jgi:peptide deformylase
MPAQRIRHLGDPILRQVSAPATAAEAAPVFADLCDTLHEFQRTFGFGRGISAVQIGVALRLVYIEIAGRSYKLRNPVFEWLSDDKLEMWDDCFSFPHLMVKLDRARTARLRYEDESGASVIIEADWPFSELLQHELDHLDGILAVDRAKDRNSFATREEWNRALRPLSAL